MSDERPDRPAALPSRRSRPTPAADQDIDPAALATPAPTPAPAPVIAVSPQERPTAGERASVVDAPPEVVQEVVTSVASRQESRALARSGKPGRPRQKPTVPLANKVDPDVMSVLDEVSVVFGLTQRDALEECIQNYWGRKLNEAGEGTGA